MQMPEIVDILTSTETLRVVAIRYYDNWDTAQTHELQARWASVQPDFASAEPKIILNSEAPGPESPTARHASYWTGRQALMKALGGLNADAQARWISLSHSSGMALGAVATQDASILGLGVDLERRDRALSESVVKRYLAEAAQRTGLEPIQVWCVQEACFKAANSNLKTFSEVELQSWNGSEGRARTSAGFEFRVREIELPGFCVMLAERLK